MTLTALQRFLRQEVSVKHAVIVAHPNVKSLTHVIGREYAKRVRSFGQQVAVRDLYRRGFDPCLQTREIPSPEGCVAAADVKAERRRLADVDVFVLVYPLWFNGPPAILKGYLDRVFSMGFGYEPCLGHTEPLLEGKRLISFTTSGAPEQWVTDTGALQALSTLLDHHLAAMCGLTVVDHVHNGGIVADLNREAFNEILQRVRRAADAHFGPLASREVFSLRNST